MSRRSEEIDRVTRQFDREIDRLVEGHKTHVDALLAQIDMLQKFINPQVDSTPPEFELSEEAEHLKFSAEAGTIDPTLMSQLEEVGIDPGFSIESGTD